MHPALLRCSSVAFARECVSGMTNKFPAQLCYVYTMKLLAGQRLSDRLARNPPTNRAPGELLGCLRICHSMEGTMDVAFLPGAMSTVLLEWIAAASGARPARLNRQRIRSGSFVIDFQTDQYWIGAE